MNKPIMKNIVSICEEEAKVLLRYFQSRVDDHVGWEESRLLKGIEWLNKHNKGTICDFVDLPESIQKLWRWFFGEEKLFENERVILHEFYVKLRPHQLLNRKLGIIVNRYMTGKNIEGLRSIVEEVFGNQIHRLDYDGYTIYYPSKDKAIELYDKLTQYLIDTPTAIIQAQTLRAQAYRVAKFLEEKEQQCSYMDEAIKSRIFY